jgi:hypothetical protein
MKKLSDFQSTDVPRASISEGISIDADENSLSEHSNSQNSLDDESFDDSTEISNNKTDQMTVKVYNENKKIDFDISRFIRIVCNKRSSRFTAIGCRKCHVSIYIYSL